VLIAASVVGHRRLRAVRHRVRRPPHGFARPQHCACG